MHRVLDGGRARCARYWAMLKRARTIDLGVSMFQPCPAVVSESRLSRKE